MVGGFLGAGKTTALLRLAEHLTKQGRRVGLITNDQSHGLVDTSFVTAHGYPVQEITGGCFCCRFNSLTEASDRLMQEAKPHVFLAEPVGSCTDLRATVQYPLSRLYGNDYRIAPLSVLVDPMRARRILGLEPGRTFSPKVLYVYEKQLEEADFIVINKSDLLTADEQRTLQGALHDRYPQAEIFTVSARTGSNLDQWFGRLAATTLADRRAMDIDYDMYAEGEALLGWLNATVRIAAPAPVDGNRFLQRLASGIRGRLAADGLEIAHLKMTLTPVEGDDIAALNLVRTDGEPELSHRLDEAVAEGQLILNLRAEGDPNHLHVVVGETLVEASREMGVDATIEHSEYFRPGRPSPTHRMATIGADL
ncbi:MAG: cobalamin biosynthesis protein P47K [Luteitalea sp.]|nr:cobalamin biosynthesis protein P47K [Luteitalea sp.]